jgi:hypothetical protein
LFPDEKRKVGGLEFLRAADVFSQDIKDTVNTRWVTVSSMS